MPTYRTLLTGIVLPALLGACADQPGREPGSQYYAYPAGLTVSLERALAIPPGEATVRLQYGHTVARNGVQETDPYCILELGTVSDAAQTVPPGSFRITRSQRRVEAFSGMPVMFAPLFGGGIGEDGGPSQIYYITEFRLHSDAQPDVRSLTCQHDQGTGGVGIPRHLTLAEMRQALGGYFVLDLGR
ncbi:MAG: hypothetical protein PHX10_02735 [Gallionellaceae bacterium]|nr:hypothetical protein [Gallionellaceae bacterium]